MPIYKCRERALIASLMCFAIVAGVVYGRLWMRAIARRKKYEAAAAAPHAPISLLKPAAEE